MDKALSEKLPEIDGYDLQSIIGSGGSGTVYKAYDERHHRTVAVKILTDAVDARTRRAYKREISAMGRLGDHPNIVPIHHSGLTASGRPFLVMPFYAAGSYSELIRRAGPMAWPDVVEVGIRTAAALETAHLRGVIHRDVKPSNIFISDYGAEPILGDFGVSSIKDHFLTTTTSIAMTLLYAAPEVIDGSEPTERSDIYSLGATLFFLASGDTAHRSTTHRLH